MVMGHRACQIACPEARGYHIFTLGYQKLSIFVSMLSSPVARNVIQATKHNKDLSTPGSIWIGSWLVYYSFYLSEILDSEQPVLAEATLLILSDIDE